VAVPNRRRLLEWLHDVEDDDGRSVALEDGARLIQRAQHDGLIEAQDVDGFAALVIALEKDDLIGFDALVRSLAQFGMDPAYDLQQAASFRSTAKGRQWLAPSASGGQAITLQGSTVGQVAGGNITNYLRFGDVLDAAERALASETEVDEAEREDARGVLQSLRVGAGGVATGATASVAGRMLAQALGLGP